MKSLTGLKALYTTINQGFLVGDLPFIGFEGVSLRVRGVGNADYQKLYGELAAGVERDKDGMLPVPDQDRISLECLKRTLLIGWEGLDDPFTPETVDGIFAHPDLGPSFRTAVLWAASRAGEKAAAAIETDIKN